MNSARMLLIDSNLQPAPFHSHEQDEGYVGLARHKQLLGSLLQWLCHEPAILVIITVKR